MHRHKTRQVLKGNLQTQKQNYPNTQENEQMFQETTLPKQGIQLRSSVKNKQRQVTKKTIEILPGPDGVVSY